MKWIFYANSAYWENRLLRYVPGRFSFVDFIIRRMEYESKKFIDIHKLAVPILCNYALLFILWKPTAKENGDCLYQKDKKKEVSLRRDLTFRTGCRKDFASVDRKDFTAAARGREKIFFGR